MIPTTEIAQGIRSAYAFDINKSIEDKVIEMTSTFDDLKCGEITNAVRNTNLDCFDITEGDIIGLDIKKIIADS